MSVVFQLLYSQSYPHSHFVCWHTGPRSNHPECSTWMLMALILTSSSDAATHFTLPRQSLRKSKSVETREKMSTPIWAPQFAHCLLHICNSSNHSFSSESIQKMLSSFITVISVIYYFTRFSNTYLNYGSLKLF